MMIRRRLAISNFLMILLPVGFTFLIALGCLVLVWLTVTFGGGVGFEDHEDFVNAGEGLTELVEKTLHGDPDNQQARLERVGALLDAQTMRLVVEQNGAVIYEQGAAVDVDAGMMQAATLMKDGGAVSKEGRTLFARTAYTNGETYQIFLYGSEHDVSYEYVETAIAIVAGILLAAIVLSMVLTNRFLIRFIFRKIEQPLDILAEGVAEIGRGNLDYRIHYEGRDEFTPICAQFNEMAVRLKHSVEETQRHEESRKELMAGISHDLRSPLTSIQAYVEGLLDGVANTPEKQQRYLRTIKMKAEEIQRMVSQMFLYSKMELEEYPIHLESLALDEEIRALLEVVTPEYAAKGLVIQADTLPSVKVAADAELLRRILTNVMDNSCKYKTAAQGHFSLAVREEAETVVLTLADDGPGVSETALPKLFDVFYRSDPARHNPNQGSGLGLAIVAKAVRRMNGTIAARANTPHGLVIEIQLPKGE